MNEHLLRLPPLRGSQSGTDAQPQSAWGMLWTEMRSELTWYLTVLLALVCAAVKGAFPAGRREGRWAEKSPAV